MAYRDSGANTAFQKSYSKLINKFPKGKSEQKHVFSLETRNGLSFPSSCEVLNLNNLPLNQTPYNFSFMLGHMRLFHGTSHVI